MKCTNISIKKLSKQNYHNQVDKFKFKYILSETPAVNLSVILRTKNHRSQKNAQTVMSSR